MSDLTVSWTRADRKGTPLLVALHGRGADETSLVPLFSQLPDAFTIAAVRGPIALDTGGYTWFENRGIGRPVESSIKATSDLLFSWLDEVADDHESVTLLGFSGGTAMAGGLLITRPARFVAAVLLSGTLPWDAGMNDDAGRLSGQPVFWGLDPADAVIPQELLRRSEAWLRDLSGAALEVNTYPGMGHAISPQEVADVSRFLEMNAL